MKLRTPLASARCAVTRFGTAAAWAAAFALIAGCAADLAGPDAPGSTAATQSAFATTKGALAGGSVSPDKNQAGFPTWYADVKNVALEPCIDPLDPHCVVLPLAGVYDASQPQVFPGNFPDESFYTLVDSAPIDVAQCGNTGSVSVGFALECAFAGGVPKQGDQMTFGRIRFTGEGLCPLHDYRIRHPYGTLDITTDDRGRVRPKNPAATADVGCLPAPGAPCDFSVALQSANMQIGFLQWDPAVPPAADPGYLSGNADTLHPVIGGLDGYNKVSIHEVNGTLLYETDLFAVSGKIASTLKASSDIIDVGRVETGTAQTRNITLTNGGPSEVTVTALTVSPVGNGWSVTSDCTAALAPASSCTIRATFAAGTSLGTAQATLSIANGTSAGLINVALAGQVVAAGTPPSLSALTVDGGAVAVFGRVIIGNTSTQLLNLRNEGPGDLSLASLAVADTLAGSGDAGQFAHAHNCPVAGTLKSGETCLITQKFSPVAHKLYAATLTVAGAWTGGPAAVAMALTGRGGIAQSSTGIDGLAVDGFPMWYQDDGDLASPALAGTRVAQCLDVNNPLCVVLTDGGYNPALPLSFPTNYPGEAFYYIVDTANFNVSDCGTGKAVLRFALEQTFANGVAAVGEQMVFARQRLTVTGGLCPNTAYTLKHPYGTDKFSVDATGAIKTNQGVVDTGCVPAPGQPCNFDLAVNTAISDRYLRWDPAVAPAAPAGYLGDPGVPHTVVGSPIGFHQAQLVNDTSGAIAASTNVFSVAGKLAAPALAVSVGSLDFGTVAPVAPGNTSVRTVTVTNPGTSSTTLAGVAISGDAIFAVTASTCGLSLSPNASCVLSVTMTGAGTSSAHAATLTVLSDAGAKTVALAGAVGNTAVLVANPLALAFGNQTISTTSAAKTVAISNGGPSALAYALRISAPVPGKTTVAGPFSVTVPTGCSAALYGAIGCSISVTFRPTTAGNFTQNVTILSDKGGSKVVTLTGTGVATPKATLAPTPLTIKANAKGVATLTNTGTIAIQMGQPVFAIAGTHANRFTVTATTCPAAGGSLLVASACKFTVSYTRPAGLAATLVHTASLTVNSTAGAKTIALRGTN